MPLYRKKPVTVDAVRWTGNNLGQIDALVGRATNVSHRGDQLRIRTLEGVMVCEKGDWLLKGVEGEFYPCKPNIFAKTYEPVLDPNIIHPASPDAPGPSPEEET